MAKSSYRVVGDAPLAVDGNEYAKGDEFKTDSLTDEQAAALVEGGHIKAINTTTTTTKAGGSNG